MMRTRTYSMKRVVAIATFVVALILLTGTPAKVREITINEDARTSEEELKSSHPDVVPLPRPRKTGSLSVEEAISRRRSVRRFRDAPVLLADVSQLLWAAQGVTGEDGIKRAAPSAGAKYPIEIFVVAGKVDDLAAGAYRYIPKTHSLEMIRKGDLRSELCDEALSQECVREAALDIVIAGVYSRTMEKYGDRGIRYVHIEVGAVAENIHLQAETLGLGTTFVGAFSDEGVKKILRIDAEPLGIMPVGVRQQ
ncbi:MAG: SagB/ThcOx family dehydrogenase [Candidatus Eisenbacteria bacterium]